MISTFEHWKPNSSASVPYLIKRSTNDGRSWKTIATVEDGQSGEGRPSPVKWTPSLLELPQRIGRYPAGTILLAGLVWDPAKALAEVQVWRSPDHGRSWKYVGVAQQSSADKRPIWEPFLYVAANGKLVMHFSDERDPAHSQKLSQIVSPDGGDRWGPVTDVVAAPPQHLRPGMPIVTRLPNGRFVLSYELVGAPIAADAMIKESTDGINWGDPADLGRRPQTADHRYLASYPYVVWAPGGGPRGQLILSAGYSIDSREPKQTPEQLQSALVSYDLGKTWHRMHLPFKPKECDGTLWGASLLPSKDGRQLRLDSPAGRPGSTHCGVFAGQANVGTLPYRADFSAGDDPGWVRYSGTWSVGAGNTYVQSGAGGKSLVGSTGWNDYRAATDVTVNGAESTAGLVFRVTDPELAPTSQDGYFATIGADGKLVLGRNAHQKAPVVLATTAVKGGVVVGAKYRLTVVANGARIGAELRAVGSERILASVRATDSAFRNGNIGLVSSGQAAFGNIAVHR
nr:exo-alpha-sialidase [Kribbella sandramycini]